MILFWQWFVIKYILQKGSKVVDKVDITYNDDVITLDSTLKLCCFTLSGLTTTGTEQKACIKVLYFCQARAIFNFWGGCRACLILQAWNLSFKRWKSVFTILKFRSWLSKPVSKLVSVRLKEDIMYQFSVTLQYRHNLHCTNTGTIF